MDTAAVQRHRTTIVDCVKDADVSIRRRALELVYSLVNEVNITTLTRELLDYLAVCDAEFKPDLTAKVATLVQRFAPSKRWHIDSLMQVWGGGWGGGVEREGWGVEGDGGRKLGACGWVGGGGYGRAGAHRQPHAGG